MLGETVFKDEFFNIEPELLNDLVPGRWWDWASNTETRLDLPVHQLINSMQSYALLNLTSPQILQRVYDAAHLDRPGTDLLLPLKQDDRAGQQRRGDQHRVALAGPGRQPAGLRPLWVPLALGVALVARVPNTRKPAHGRTLRNPSKNRFRTMRVV